MKGVENTRSHHASCLSIVKNVFDLEEQSRALKVLLKHWVSHAYVKIIQDPLEYVTIKLSLFDNLLIINVKWGIRQGDACSQKGTNSHKENLA